MSMLPTRDQMPQLVQSPLAHGMPAAAGAPAQGGGLTGRDMLRILRRRKWWILISVLAATALSVAGTLVWIAYAPRYDAVALLRVQLPKSSEITLHRETIVGDEMVRLLNDHVKRVLREDVLKVAIQKTGVTESRWYKNQTDKSKLVEELLKSLSVAVVQDTFMLQVRMSDTAVNYEERGGLANIATAVAQTYVEIRNEEASLLRRGQITLLKSELAAIDGQYNAKMREIDEVRRESAVPQMQERRALVSMRQQEAQSQMMQLDMLVEEYTRGIEMIEKAPDAKAVMAIPEIAQAFNDDAELRSLRQQEAAWTNVAATRAQRLGKMHKTTRAAEDSLKSVTEQRIKREQAALNEIASRYMNAQKTGLANARSRRTKIQSIYTLDLATSRDLVERMAKLDTMTREAEGFIRSREKLQDALRELQLLERGEEHEVRMAGVAEVPMFRSAPKWGIMVPLGVLVGLLLGAGLAFGLELLDTSIKSPSDVARRVDLPLLGAVPHTDDLEEGIDELASAFLQGPDTMVAEAFRQIRTCLMFSGPAEHRRSLMITSPMPEDGRTSVTMNLAAAIVRGGRRVLVVDANFRQPRLAELFPQAAGAGLSTALVGQVDWRQVLHEIEPNLSVMAAGPMPPNPAELLGSEEARRIITEAVAEYDQVLFDAPPCLVVTDPSVLSTMVDGVILVVRAGANTYGMVQRTRDMLTRLGAHIVGVILNGIRVTAGGYLRKNYDRFYEYSEPALPEPQSLVVDGKKDKKKKKKGDDEAAEALESGDPKP